jgi:virginiamycin B lyase
MSTRQKTTARRLTRSISALALVTGSLVAIAPAATAAPGDIATFATGATTTGIAEDSDGNLWVTNTGANSISKVALDGTVITYASAIQGPGDIALGPGGNMWFTSPERVIGWISPQGAIQSFALPDAASDVAAGPDGNMWFTIPDANQVGKVTPTGAVTTYSTGTDIYSFITPGPEGSNRMYMASAVAGNLGIVQMNGTVGTIAGPPNSVSSNDIQLINDQIWFIPVTRNGTSTLTRLVNDSSFAQIVDGAMPSPFNIGTGIDGTMWVASFNSTVSHVTTAGAVVATYGTGGVLRRSLQAQDGNVWATVGDGVNRILTGVVPTSTAAPTLDPTTGLAAGTAVNTTNGSWNYRPTSYSYQWQSCATAEATSCTDVPGATGQSYTVATTDVGKYIRAGVRASNLNGASQPAYSALAAAGAAPAPTPPAPVPATGAIANIGNGAVMELDAPAKQKRKKRKFYEVVFSVTDVQGTVTFEFKKGKRTKTKTVLIEDGIAEYRWKTPRKWRKGRTTVTATFIPAAGSPYTAAEVRDRVRIR